MQLTLYKTTSAPNVINKVLSEPLTLQINLKASTDIIDPVITLSHRVGVNYLDYNYAHIAELNRYYTIDSVDSVNGKVWQLSLQCDVLETYKTQILNSNAQFMRSIRSGDYVAKDLVFREDKVVTQHMGTFTLGDEHSNILTVLEQGETA